MLSGIKRWTSSDFLAFEQKAIPLSFNNSFKPLLSYSLLVPVSYVRIFHVFPFLPLPRVSRFLVFKSFAVSFDFWISKCSCYVRFEHQLSYACLNCQGLCPAFSHVSWNGKFFFFFFFFSFLFLTFAINKKNPTSLLSTLKLDSRPDAHSVCEKK